MARVTLLNVRCSFPVVFTPEVFEGGNDNTPSFSIAGIMEPTHPQLPALNKLIDEIGTAKFGTQWPNVKKAADRLGKICLKDGDLKPNIAGYPGNWIINARDPVRPTVVGPDRAPLDAASGKPYSGCYVNLIIDLFAYTKGAKGIGARLKGVQFVKDGDAFSGGPPASADDFDDMSDVGDEDVGSNFPGGAAALDPLAG